MRGRLDFAMWLLHAVSHELHAGLGFLPAAGHHHVPPQQAQPLHISGGCLGEPTAVGHAPARVRHLQREIQQIERSKKDAVEDIIRKRLPRQ
jgi:hypothetical protein